MLTLPLDPIFSSVIETPFIPDTNTVELGLTQVIFGLGKPNAEQLKAAGLGEVTVRFSGS